MSDTRVPEIELVKFLTEVLTRKPAKDKERSRSVGCFRARRYPSGTIVYTTFRLLEHEYDRLCQLTNDARHEFGWPRLNWKLGEGDDEPTTQNAPGSGPVARIMGSSQRTFTSGELFASDGGSKAMTVYEVTQQTEDGYDTYEVCLFRADLSQASGPVEIHNGRGWEDTPFQVASGKHDGRAIALLLMGWLGLDGEAYSTEREFEVQPATKQWPIYEGERS